jgi:hypothetical protein
MFSVLGLAGAEVDPEVAARVRLRHRFTFGFVARLQLDK